MHSRPITMDFQKLYMSFVKDSHTYLLWGIKANPFDIIVSHYMENLLKKSHLGIIPQFHAIQGCEIQLLTPHHKWSKF